MKILFFFLCTILFARACQQHPCQWFNSLVSHFDPGEVIYIKNCTSTTISILNNLFWLNDKDEKLFLEKGIVIAPYTSLMIDLCRIASKEKINFLNIIECKTKFNKFSKLKINFNKVKIEIGAKYLIYEINNKLNILKVNEIE